LTPTAAILDQEKDLRTEHHQDNEQHEQKRSYPKLHVKKFLLVLYIVVGAKDHCIDVLGLSISYMPKACKVVYSLNIFMHAGIFDRWTYVFTFVS
jgi:hypothetical protein